VGRAEGHTAIEAGAAACLDAEQASAQLDRLDKRDQGRWTGVMKPMGRALEMVRKYEVEILN